MLCSDHRAVVGIIQSQTFLLIYVSQAGSTASDYETLCSLEESRGLELPKLHLKIVQNLEKIANILQTNDQDAVLRHLSSIKGSPTTRYPNTIHFTSQSN